MQQKATKLIAKNVNALRNYSIETRIESGIALQGWEVKSLRHGRMNLKDTYARIIAAEVWLLGSHISPLPNCDANQRVIDPLRSRKLLLKKKEIVQLIGATQRKAYTLVPIKAYWKNQRVKLELGLGKGKQTHDKRLDQKNRDWQRSKNILLKKSLKNS